MRIADRHDGLLLAGLAIAGFVVFGRTIQALLEIARDVEVRHGVALLPALVILTVIFVFHQGLKRQEVNTRAAAAAAEAAQANARALDLERLVSFGDALARALTFDALREVSWRHLPRLAGDREVWAFVRDNGAWEQLVGATCTNREDVLAQLTCGEGDPLPVQIAGSICFPMRVGNQVVGMVGLSDADRCDPATRHMIAAAVALLAIAVRNVQLFAETQQNATRDRLTGSYNRPQAMELLEGELRRSARTRAPLSVIMFDVDRFKQINDTYGHLAGDAALASIGQRLAETLRRSDHRCRYGGDEFLVILPETPPHAAALVADTIRRQVHALTVMMGGRTIPLTTSVGVAHAAPGESDVQQLVGRADAALYRAKRDGRNCVRVSEPPAAETEEMPAAVPVAYTSSLPN